MLSLSEYHETLLLMVGMLETAQREETFLNGIHDDLGFTLEALSRYGHAYPNRVENALDRASLTVSQWPYEYQTGLKALGNARNTKNVRAAVEWGCNLLNNPDRFGRRK